MKNPALNTLNASGFPLQVAVHQRINDTTSQHGWSVLASEHHWVNSTDDQFGFLDLVLKHKCEINFMAVECKRLRDTEWIFLRSDGSEGTEQEQKRAKAWISKYADGSMVSFNWSPLSLKPACPEAHFCAVRGQSPNDRVMLVEKTAADLVLATECLAMECQDYRPQNANEDLKRFFSVIVTTAKLTFAEFDPKAISLTDGTLEPDSVKFKSVPYVRFRKKVGTRHSRLTQEQYDKGVATSSLKESTVFIVNADEIVDFLTHFEVPYTGQ